MKKNLRLAALALAGVLCLALAAGCASRAAVRSCPYV